jgi:hypothetical protein
VKGLFKNYLQNLAGVARHGDAREESFYGVLANTLEQFAEKARLAGVHITTLPKSTDAGNPDFRIWNGRDSITGYIEAKNPETENLDYIEDSGQLQRYRSTFPNLILTNFYEFRLYRNGERIDRVLLARPFVQTRLHTVPPLEEPEQFAALLSRFFSFSLPRLFTAETLAVELAKRTRFLREEIVVQQLSEEKDTPGALTGFYEAFKQFLIGDLTEENFADLYAQTITYGLFAAKTRAGEKFSRRTAFDSIPHTIGVLRDLFRFISLGDLPAQLEWIIDDISSVLSAAEVSEILGKYFKEGKGSDPVVHFYETFLAEYDPEERERRGVYYTPEPVVSYIVRSLHELLKTEFDLADGLASEGVTLLDPAAGTMTFLARAAREAVSEFESTYGGGAREDFIRRHILQNFYAFELMMAPYAVGHLKMSFFLEELGHRLADDERVRFYLTNALDMEELEQSRLPGLSSLAEESRLAGEVKKQTPILVLLGNPPYSGHSANRGEWILDKIEDYKKVDGKPLGERNPKWLQDDYVKFLRFAQNKIEEAGRGMVGMITNHGYLDNPTFRGMRQSLMQTFDKIYLLDLHGNSLKREVCPDGSKDENVFDIRQGVAIALFIKHGSATTEKGVYHADLWGTREQKYTWLNGSETAGTKWNALSPSPPFYLFTPIDKTLMDRYNSFISIAEIFPINSVGLVTARDGLTIKWSSEEVWSTVTVFSKMDENLAREAYALGRDSRDWKVELAQKDLLDSGPVRNKIVPVQYRPFDTRYTYYTGKSRGFICRPRGKVMQHMLVGDNMAIIAPKRVEHTGPWQHAYVSQNISEHVAVSQKTIDYHFPLYLYPATDKSQLILFSQPEPSERQPNLNPQVVEILTSVYRDQPAPEIIFHYIYAILYAPTFREQHCDFLRIDFPRIPFAADRELFKALAAFGERLVTLHLLQSPDLDPPVTRFEGPGDGYVGKSKGEGFYYNSEDQRLYINKTQYFAPLPPDVWSYQVGGYQVCDKWLKDRRQRKLDINDIRTYCRIVTALKKTIEIQREIDELYPAVEADILTWPD